MASMQHELADTKAGLALASEAVDRTAAVVSVAGLVKRFRRRGGSTAAAVDGVSFDVGRGEFLVLLGPSGCGKTTLLRTIAGLERADAGEVSIHGRVCYSAEKQIHVPTERRNISMIFQSYALWPHMTIFDNVAYPLRNARPRPKSARITEQVEQILALVNISELSRQYPGQMSGGQQQRAALARALVAGSDLVLFDEPLSNVDAKVREQLRNEMLDMQRSFGFSGIYVTHDQHEAMGLADRIAVMREGKIAQIGPPRQIYGEPASRYVANFIGRANEIAGRVIAVDSTECAVDTPLGKLIGFPGQQNIRVGEEVVLVWRPEHGVISPDTSVPSGPNVLNGEITTELFLGTHTERTVRVGDRDFLVWGLGSALVPSGAQIGLSIVPAQMRVLRKNDDDF